MRIFMLLALLCLSIPGRAEEKLTLVGRSLTVKEPINVSLSERIWLAKNKELNVGVILPSYEPFEVISYSRDFEGISADILQYIHDELKIKVNIKAYNDSASAKKAMLSGDIDMLSVGSWFSIENENLVGSFSKPFLKSKLLFSTLRTRVDKYELIPNGTRVAAPKGIVNEAVFQLTYPHAILVEYASPLAAMDAVYFGYADVMISDVYSTHFLSGERFGDFVFIGYAKHDPRDFGFFVSERTPQLLSLVNQSIENLQSYGRVPIISRWRGAMTEILLAKDILKSSELNWIRDRGSITVGINKNNVPYTFIGHEGKPAGIACDVLEIITFLSGLDFLIKEYNSDDELKRALATGDVDLMAAYHNKVREKSLVSTINYNRDDVIVLTSDRMSIDNSGQFIGKRIAASRENVSERVLRHKYPKAEIVFVSSGIDTLRLLSEGKVNGAVTSLYQSKYFLASERISENYLFLEKVNEQPLEFSFALRASDGMLLNVLNKVIKAIPPSDLSKISFDWRNTALPRITFWEKYTTELSVLVFTAISAFIIYFMRAYYLNKELQHKRELEGKLLDELHFNRTLLDGLPMPIAVRDTFGRLIFYNKYYLSALDVKQEDVFGKTIVETFSNRVDSDSISLIGEIYTGVLLSGIQSVRDISISWDGKNIEIYQWVIPFRDSHDKIKGIVCGSLDVTERKTLQVQLEIEKEKAEQASLAKSNFLAVMSHELRTPMNAIIGFIELSLKKAKVGDIDIDSLSRASEAADALLDLIGGILDISSIEAMKFTINNKGVNLNKLVSSTIGLLQPVASAQDNELLYFSEISDDEHIVTDPIRLRQIIYNVVGNSLKFTRSGIVEVNIKLVGDDFVIIVSDNGVGIPKEKIDDIFQPFSQAHNNYHSGYSGSGLGLSIVKQICIIMGGNVELSSEEGVGTRVTITLPFEPYLNEHPGELFLDASSNIKSPESHLERRILVVDDHIANRVLMQKQLEYIGYHVVTACDGVEALDVYTTESIDLIITDCQMPNMDGYTLTRTIRKLEQESDKIPVGIYGLTASAMQNDFDKCIESGMDDCLFKPFKLTVMAEKIKKYFNSLQPLLDDNIDDITSEWKKNLRRQFIECCVSDIDDVVFSYGRGDTKRVMHYIHRLKGSCQVFGENEIVSLCKVVEREYTEVGLLREELISDIELKVKSIRLA